MSSDADIEECSWYVQQYADVLVIPDLYRCKRSKNKSDLLQAEKHLG